MDGYCIEITVTPEGMSVASRPLDEDDQGGTPVKTIDDALEMVRSIHANNGNDPAVADEQANKEFAAGFA